MGVFLQDSGVVIGLDVEELLELLGHDVSDVGVRAGVPEVGASSAPAAGTLLAPRRDLPRVLRNRSGWGDGLARSRR